MSAQKLTDIFGRSLHDFSSFEAQKSVNSATIYITASVDDELAGYAQMQSFQHNESLEFLEVHPNYRRKGYGTKLREEAFRFAAEHSGTILLSPPTDMGKLCLIKSTATLAKKFPALNIIRVQTC